MAAETADYGCPYCSGQLVRDNTPEDRFRCDSCGEVVHELAAKFPDKLRELAAEDGPTAKLARLVLEGEV